MSSNPDNTRYTLLHRALDTGDEEAWEQLVAHYRRFIYYILNELNVNASDLDEVCQQVLVALTKDLPKFDRDKGRFRSWLSAVIRNTAGSHFRTQCRHRSKLASLRTELECDCFTSASGLDHRIEREWTAYIATQAMERVKACFKGNAIDVFEQSLNGLSASDIAGRTGLTVASVYTLKKRVKKQLCIEIMDLTAELEP